MTERERFETTLRGTNRPGVEKVINGLSELGFFTAPASTRFHGCVPGGLLTHSLNVYDQSVSLRELKIGKNPALAERLPVESVVLVAFLHDCLQSRGVQGN